jgi:hypothetical protein
MGFRAALLAGTAAVIAVAGGADAVVLAVVGPAPSRTTSCGR